MLSFFDSERTTACAQAADARNISLNPAAISAIPITIDAKPQSPWRILQAVVLASGEAL
jgi:hypothetical protein